MKGVGMAGISTPANEITTPAMLDVKTLLENNAKIQQQLKDLETQQLNDGKAIETANGRIRMLKQAAQQCNLYEPEQVKEWLRKTEWKTSTKIRFIDAYNTFADFTHMNWKPPHYTPTTRIPFIPIEEELNALINGSGKTISTALLTIKETGIRIGELCFLTWKDLDTKNKSLNITPEKGSNPRILPITDTLIGMLNTLPKIHGNNIFTPHKHALRDNFDTQRKHIAEKLNNPRLMQISFHTFRHWKGTTEYHATKDIMHVKQILGHKSVTSTEIYITLEASIFLQSNEYFTCKIAHTEQEEAELIEAGFEHINNRDNLAFYRKRK